MGMAAILRGLLGTCLVAAAAVAPAQPVAELPVETFFRKAAYSGMVMSPDQKFLAALAPLHGRQNLVVIDLEKRHATHVTDLKDVDVQRVHWANNRRLLFTTGDTQGLESRTDGGLFGVDRDGKNGRMLVEPFRVGSIRFVWRTTSLIGRIKGREDEVWVSANDRSATTQDIYRMNVVNGRKTLVSFNSPGNVVSWVLDNDNVPRAALCMDIKKRRWWFALRDGDTWKTVAEWDERLRDVVIPKAFDPADKDNLYVASNVGRDTLAYFRFDLRTGKLGELIYGDDRYDVGSFHLLGAPLGEGGSLIFGGTEEEPGRLLGLSYQADKPKRVWFDEEAAKSWAMIERALPGQYSSFDPTQRRTLVHARSDTNPGRWYLFDQDKKSLEDTGVSAMPQIDPAQMAPMRPVAWMARDGVLIDGYLTLPRGHDKARPPPLVLHPHGGPWAKDNWRFDPEVQFLANRGFAVLQPNFRGSTGRGAKHLTLSYKQWGGTMVDDMIDGVEWAVQQGFADKDRIAAYGASYGGYATLAAMVKRPDLFRWGVNYVGVTDLAVHQSTQPAQLYWDFGELAKILHGDKTADAALFEATSPARHVDRIAAPVFHAYGGEDVNVDFANGRAIKSAFEQAKKPFEWMYVGDEAHGYRQDRNVFEFYGRLDRFMKANTPAAK